LARWHKQGGLPGTSLLSLIHDRMLSDLTFGSRLIAIGCGIESGA
jgi:hypothetical protein